MTVPKPKKLRPIPKFESEEQEREGLDVTTHGERAWEG